MTDKEMIDETTHELVTRIMSELLVEAHASTSLPEKMVQIGNFVSVSSSATPFIGLLTTSTR